METAARGGHGGGEQGAGRTVVATATTMAEAEVAGKVARARRATDVAGREGGRDRDARRLR